MGIIFEDWNYECDIKEYERSSNNLFESKIYILCENLLKSLDYGSVNNINETDKDYLPLKNDDELKSLIERNNELKQEIEFKLKELTQHQAQYEIFKRDQKLLEHEIKDTHEAFLMARKHFKKCLNIYYSIESRSNDTQVIYIQFFTELKKNGENYSLYLHKDIKTHQYTLQSINPKLKSHKDFQRKLQETNDVPGLLCWIRQAFITHKLNKDH